MKKPYWLEGISEEAWAQHPDNPESDCQWCQGSEECDTILPAGDEKVCDSCREDPELACGWGVFNSGENGLGPDEVEVQKIDGLDVFTTDEDAADKHFDEWEVRNIDGFHRVVARNPKTPEARHQVAFHRRALGASPEVTR